MRVAILACWLVSEIVTATQEVEQGHGLVTVLQILRPSTLSVHGRSQYSVGGLPKYERGRSGSDGLQVGGYKAGWFGKWLVGG